MDKFTIEEQKSLYVDLNKKLEKHFKDYEIKVVSTEIYFDLASPVADGNHILYSTMVQINNNPEEIRGALCEMLTYKGKIHEIYYPEIPKEVKLKRKSSDLEK